MSDETLSPDPDTPGDHAVGAFVVSAYVDGQATADERAQVEASPELLALAESYRSLRTSLQDVPPPTASSRDAALAAALGAFDTLSTATAAASGTAAAPPRAPVAPNVVSFERRRRWNRVMAAAAAVAIVGLAGVALAGMFSGSSDEASSSGTALSAEANPESLNSSKVGVAGVVDTTAGDAAVQPNVSDTNVTVDTNATVVTDTATGPTETIGSIDGGASPVPAYTEPASLRALPEPTGGVAPSFQFDCPLESTQEIVLEITWRGTPALVVRDTVTRLITVLDAQCTTLVTVQP